MLSLLYYIILYYIICKPNMGQYQVFDGEIIFMRVRDMTHPLQNFHENLSELGNKVNFGNKRI